MVIGLTGGIASGKSTVSQMFADLGAIIIDADKIAREVVKPNEPALDQIRHRFGEQVMTAEGTLDRKALGKIVFEDEQARIDLNRITHPAIRQRMQQRKEEAQQTGAPWVVLDIPLLFESKNEYTFDKILVVYVPEAVQKERLMQREGIDEREAERKIRSQMSIEEKKHKGDAFIDNSGTKTDTKQQLMQILNRWKEE